MYIQPSSHSPLLTENQRNSKDVGGGGRVNLRKQFVGMVFMLCHHLRVGE